jgi:hypothetical protein
MQRIYAFYFPLIQRYPDAGRNNALGHTLQTMQTIDPMRNDAQVNAIFFIPSRPVFFIQQFSIPGNQHTVDIGIRSASDIRLHGTDNGIVQRLTLYGMKN